RRPASWSARVPANGPAPCGLAPCDPAPGGPAFPVPDITDPDIPVPEGCARRDRGAGVAVTAAAAARMCAGVVPQQPPPGAAAAARGVGEGGLGDDRHVGQLAGHDDRLDQLVEVAEGLQDEDVDASVRAEQSLDLLANDLGPFG